jgi:Ser/Thr protein kinase RdoA (MazF antagonist)
MSQNSDSAVAAALAVAGKHGLHSEQPVVLRDAWHVLLHLRPLPIVARVSTGLPFPEGPNPNDVVRELELAAHAARRGAPVVPPADEVDAVPYEHGGHAVTFWRYVEPHDAADAAAAGHALRAIHDALADFDGSLPDTGHPEETRQMIAALPSEPEQELLYEVLARRPDVDGQALHGDAHLGNCLGTPSGPLWHDFETGCRGPREYDLAALVMRDRISGDNRRSRTALGAYGAHDADLLDELLPLYVAWVTVSMLIALPRRPELRAVVDEQLAWLRNR